MDNPVRKKKAIPKPTHFGKNLKFLRLLNGLSQQQLADKCGLTRNNIASYEAGSAEPSAKVFLRIANFFNEDPKNMLDVLLVDHALDTSQVVVPKLNPVKQQQFKEVLDEVIHQTNEMTKIYEGFSSLIEIKNTNKEDRIEIELYSSFTDLLDLLKTLIEINWDFIHSMVPSEIKDD